jgi:hypothetical protein
LFIAADGPRADKMGESDLCKRARQTVLDRIDWPCVVFTLFRDGNLGCKEAVSSGISWFFDHVEAGVILEDDCLPSESFFSFCQELLKKYEADPRVMMISGDNFQPKQRGDASYYFSRYTHIWGWATWRRAWRKYDMVMKSWPHLKRERRFASFLSPLLYRKAEQLFDGTSEGKTTTWDTQWLYACWANSGLSIIPNLNLVTNIDAEGTHMKVYDPCINLPAGTLSLPLEHPLAVEPNQEADAYTERYVYFRDWQRALILMGKYLVKELKTHPLQFHRSVGKVLENCFAEIRHRRALGSMQKGE